MTKIRFALTNEAAQKLVEKIQKDPSGFEEFMKKGGFDIKAADVKLIRNEFEKVPPTIQGVC
jgi:hypothetical protein